VSYFRMNSDEFFLLPESSVTSNINKYVALSNNPVKVTSVPVIVTLSATVVTLIVSLT